MYTLSHRPTAATRLDVTARAETVRGGEVVPAYSDAAWTPRPTPRPNGWTGALLVIGDTTYSAESSWYDDGQGHHWQVVDLRKPDDKHLRIVFGPGAPDGSCDCEHATYRGATCKHLAAVRVALDWLERTERDEWEAAIAAVPGARPDDVDLPF
jgi:hypothetical protein